MILNKSQLVANISNEISDNSTGEISPHDIRHNLLDIIDSAHLLLVDRDVQSQNFATPAVRNTRGGDSTLANLSLDNYTSEDNTAFGYSALKSSYQTARNTALGSLALSCNIYGQDNAGVGYNALGGTTNGFGNVGLGNFSLVGNKVGHFNVAIGHAAGYYVDRSTCNKLFIASHNVDGDYICSNPLGSGLIPLVYGDFASGILGVNVRDLHSDGVLQVGGSAAPSETLAYNLGSQDYSWDLAYVRGLQFGSGLNIERVGDALYTNSHLIPTGNVSDLGSVAHGWRQGYFHNITVSGTATINRFNAYEHYEYFHKTIHLASSGAVEVLDGGGANSIFDYAYHPGFEYLFPLLTDEEMTGAGLIASTSGVDYRRDYGLVYAPPSANHIACDASGYAGSAWVSNISVVLDSGNYLKTNRVIGYDNCFGMFFDGGNAFFGRKNILDANPSHASGNLAGLGRFNFVGNSGVSENLISTIATPESGVSVSTRWLTGIKKRVKDIDNKDRLTGFECRFADTALDNLSIQSDRFILGSYNDTSYLHNSFVLMKNSQQGIVGIVDLGVLSENIVPKTVLDIRTTGNAIIRSTAENPGNSVAALQLLGQDSCEYNGAEFAYLNGSGVADISMFQDSGKQVYVRFYEGINNDLDPDIDFYRIGILNTVSGVNDSIHGMLSLGSAQHNGASISLREFEKSDAAFASYPTLRPNPMANRGIAFVGVKVAPQQQHSMFMIDGSGYAHDMIVNKYDVNDGRGLFTDEYQNTFGGLLSNADRYSVGSSTVGNTAYGYKALTALTSGDYNVVFGANAGSGITSGSRNIIVGANSAKSLTNGSYNIVIGDDTFTNTSSSISHNIIIGNSGVGSGISSSYNLMVGLSRNCVLLHGKLGPTNADKYLAMPSGGWLHLYNSNNSDSLSLGANTVEVKDYSGSNYPDQDLSFKFTGAQSATLLKLNHNANPITSTPTYDPASSGIPYAELAGDLRIKSAIRFSDGTSLDSTHLIDVLDAEVADIENDLGSLTSQLNSFVLEGTATSAIAPPSSTGIPSSGYMIVRNSSWNDIGTVVVVNRDKGLSIGVGDYVVAIKVNGEYRPLWVSNQNISCSTCS